MLRRRVFVLFISLFLFSLSAVAQLSQGGVPYSFQQVQPLAVGQGRSIAKVEIARPNVDSLLNEDALADIDMRKPFRFGEAVEVYYNFINSGTWTTLANGDRLWQLQIDAPQAVSMNFVCNEFYLPKGSTLFIYSTDKQHVLGAFTSANNNAQNVFATTIIPSSSVVFEYYEPVAVQGQGRLNINSVVYGYRSLKRSPYGVSDWCMKNVNCEPFASNEMIQKAKRSVVLILHNGNTSLCTGTLVNNTAQDGTPYIYTANHCVQEEPRFAPEHIASWVFLFNYEAVCDASSPIVEDQSIQGADSVARSFDSDFALLRLSQAPPPEFHAYYSGWSREETVSEPAYIIHHPRGDFTKVSTAQSGISIIEDWSEYSDYEWDGKDSAFWKVYWEEGSTQGGSSGGALFNRNGSVVGNLYCGYAACNLNEEDIMGRFAYSWDGADTASQRLKDWLDPLGEDPIALQGTESEEVGVVAPATKRAPMQIALYPNPAKTWVTLFAVQGVEGECFIYTLDGRKVYQKNLPNATTHTLSLAELPAGTYVLVVCNAQQVFRSLLLKQ